MKHKTIELTGALLDAAVSKADGQKTRRAHDGSVEVSILPDWDGSPDWDSPIPFSSGWRYGGPIIEREKITVFHDAWWEAGMKAEVSCSYGAASLDMNFKARGDTALVAAMRCYVFAKIGDEVDLVG